MTLSRFLSVTVISASLASCATPYEQSVSIAPLNETTYEFITKVSVHTNKTIRNNYSRLASAESCLAKGFSHFSELSKEEGIHLASFSFFETYKVRNVLRVKYYRQDEQNRPASALECQAIYNALAPKYIKP